MQNVFLNGGSQIGILRVRVEQIAQGSGDILTELEGEMLVKLGIQRGKRFRGSACGQRKARKDNGQRAWLRRGHRR